MEVGMPGSAAGADGGTAGTRVQAEGPELMVLPELLSTADHGHPLATSSAEPVLWSQPGKAGPGRLLQFQLNGLIGRILAQPNLEPDLRLALLRHLAENPGRPEQALLAHLRDVHDPEDLPPYRGGKKPSRQPSGS